MNCAKTCSSPNLPSNDAPCTSNDPEFSNIKIEVTDDLVYVHIYI